MNSQSFSLPFHLSSRIESALRKWDAEDKTRRLWQQDASLWTGQDEARWLGWTTIVGDQLKASERFEALGGEVREAGFTHALLLGMGGSSLGPEVIRSTFPCAPSCPELFVLDSTNPRQMLACEGKIDLARTLFIVSSKSGTTLESNILMLHFFDRLAAALGPGRAGDHFIAITDPGSKLEALAAARGFRRVLFGQPDIGGRFSALSDFGMAPAAVMGVDVGKLLGRAEEMVRASGADRPAEANPGVVLGTILGISAEAGRDKLTFIASPRVSSLGTWLEQLVAESTGKRGRGIIPLDGEPPGPPEAYGDDRLFVYLRLSGQPDPGQEHAIAALEQAGRPVARVDIEDIYNLGQEFFRWEMATAVACAHLGVNPFDQPDVEANKQVTRDLTAAFVTSGALPDEHPIFERAGVKLYADRRNAAALSPGAGPEARLSDYFRIHLDRLGPGDYFALSAFIEMNEANEGLLQDIRRTVRDRKRVATAVGFGPRFLHSTGQAHKGGPATGVFLQITCEDAVDLPVPGHRYTFGVVNAAQARGDFEVLSERGRRLLRVHLDDPDTAAGLERIRTAIRDALEDALP